MADQIEQQILHQFRPHLVLSANECDGQPARFEPGQREPRVLARDGTLYGRVFRVAPPGLEGEFLEAHFFHLWGRDCGRAGHPLDIEHVAVLLRKSGSAWTAVYWIASAHQDTVCDRSHGASAETLKSDKTGVTAWVSHGKHATFLTQDACRKGCGGDRCQDPLRPLPAGTVLNIGEPGVPLNGAVWVDSPSWNFSEKWASRFPAPVLQALAQGEGRLVDLRPELIPVRATVKGLNEGVDGVATADRHTTGALGTAKQKTGSAVKKATKATGDFLGIGKKQPQP